MPNYAYILTRLYSKQINNIYAIITTWQIDKSKHDNNRPTNNIKSCIILFTSRFNEWYCNVLCLVEFWGHCTAHKLHVSPWAPFRPDGTSGTPNCALSRCHWHGRQEITRLISEENLRVVWCHGFIEFILFTVISSTRPIIFSNCMPL